jgi:serine/threonine-protein kinase
MTTVEQTPGTDRIQQLLLALGKAYLERHQYREAFDKLKTLLELHPNDPEVALNAAVAAMGADDVSEPTLKIYEHAVALNPDSHSLVKALDALFSQQHLETPLAAQIRQRVANFFLQQKHIEDQKESSPVNESIQDRILHLENLWWQGQFNQALDFLNNSDKNSEAFAVERALTHAYQLVSNKQTTKNSETLDILLAGLETLTPANSLTELRHYLTLRLCLVERVHKPKEELSDFEEYKFILGLIPMEEYFSKFTNGVRQKPLDLEEFHLQKELLDPLYKSPGWQAAHEKSHQNCQGFLFAKLHAHENADPKLFDLITTQLAGVPDSLLRHTGTGYISLAADPQPQISAVIELLQRLDDYNRAAAEHSRIMLTAGVVIATDELDSKNNRSMLQHLVNAAHLLRLAEQRSGNHGRGVLLIQADESFCRNAQKNGIGVISVGELPLLPGTEVPCAEILWQNALAHVGSGAPYQLGDFEVQKRLLQHTSSATYLGRDRRLGRRVILKVIPPQHALAFLQNETARENLFEQIRRVGRLTHPHIATMFNLGEHERMIYFVREYLEGKTISEVELSRENGDHELSTLLLKIVRALSYARTQGIHHLNLKPGNIWISDAEGLKITDFQLPGFADYSRADVLFPASWRYLAPEILAGENGDHRSDMYSLGVIAYQLIEGKHPYDSAGKIDRPQDIFNLHIAALEDKTWPQFERWNDLLLKAVNGDAEKRFQTLEEFEAELQQIQLNALTRNAKIPT